MNRGGKALLAANATVVYTAVDVGSGGASLAFTLPARYATTKALDAMGKSMDSDAQKAFAGDLKRYIDSKSSLTASSRQAMSDDDIRAHLKLIDSVQEMKAKLVDDPAAAHVVESAQISLFRKNTEAQLDLISAGASDTAVNKAEIIRVGKALTSYEKKTSEALNSLSNRVADLNTSVHEAQDSITSLQEKTDLNTQQLRSIQGMMYSQSSASDRYQMLKSGYLSAELGAQKYDDLLKTVHAQAQREAIASEVGRVSGEIQKLVTIAQNLGVGKGVVDFLSTSSAIGSSVSKLAGGDYLGALAGLTGIFGGGPSPTQQIINAMNSRFDHVDAQLKTLVEGQQILGETLVQMSEQMAEYQKQTQEHLYSIDERLNTIQGLVFATYYQPLSSCDVIKSDIEETVAGVGIAQLDLRSVDQMQYVTRSGHDFASVHRCIDFLLSVYKHTTEQPSGSFFSINPLAVQWLPNGVPQLQAGASDPTSYASQANHFTQDVYAPARNFYTKALSTSLLNLGVAGPISSSSALAMAAVPMRDVPSLNIKMKLLGTSTANCDKKTALASSLVTMLCHPPVGTYAEYQNLPVTSTKSQEAKANDLAQKFLEVPIFYDALEQLSGWAEFYAPIYDLEDAASTSYITSYEQFVARSPLIANGRKLVKGALGVDTLGIAQLNLIYGDVLAAAVFDRLWDDKGGVPVEDKTLKDEAASAAKLLHSDNHFLEQNVLMLAMHKARGRGDLPVETDLSYAFALDYARTSSVDPAAQLTSLFQNKLSFQSRWLKKEVSSTSKSISECEKLSDAEKAKNCEKRIVALVAGTPVELPTLEEFSERRLVYPYELVRLISVRDGLATKTAEYEALDYTRSSGADRAARKPELANAIVQTVQ